MRGRAPRSPYCDDTMGYHAPSADEVYRYALRLDGARSLVDRFGFSIVFLNDGSPLCREFLARYCVDLCYRTADRIRFVFFSEISKGHFERMVDSMRRSHRPESMLRRIVASVAGHALDFEDEEWRGLRPDLLRPLRSAREIERHLDWRVDMCTAMPGTGEAMRFAQRLGIGRELPCMVVFTEIGELHVDVFPVSDLTPDEIFLHARGWIDEFYSRNRGKIEHWGQVEKQVGYLAQQADATVWAIRRWRDERLSSWKSLTAIADAIRTLETAESSVWVKAAGEIATDYALDQSFRSVMASLRDAMNRLDEERVAARGLADLGGEVSACTSSKDLSLLLRRVRQRLPESVSTPTLREAIADIKPVPDDDPVAELREWWIGAGVLDMSFANFRKARVAWVSGPRIGNRRARDEYTAMRDALNALQLGADPDEGAGVAVTALAICCGLKADSASFLSASAEYRRRLSEVLRALASTVPQWLPATVTLGEVVPIGEDLSRGAKQVLDSRPVLARSVYSARLKGTSEAGKARVASVATWRAAVVEELRLLSDETRQVEVTRNLRDNALVQLLALRARVEVEALASSSRGPELPTAIDRTLAAKLHRALDEYQQVTTTIEFPYRDDRRMRRVRTQVSPESAAGVERETTDPAVSLKARLRKAEDIDTTRVSEQENALRCVKNASPAIRLETALRSSLTAHRFAEVAHELPAAYLDHRIPALLESLAQIELGLLASALKCPATVDDVLVSVGLYLGPDASEHDDDAARVLAAKVRSEQFDVFLAHDSDDKEAVLEIARHLRRRGIHPWVDVEQIHPGELWQAALQTAIPRVKAAAVVLGRHGVGRWQDVEIRALMNECVERKMRLIPVLLGESEIPQDLLFLKQLHAVRFAKGTADVQAVAELSWGISS